MIKISIRSLLAHKVRTAMAILAVVLGAGFVSGTFVFSDALSRVLDSAVQGSATDLLVTPKPAVGGNSQFSSNLTLSQADVSKVAAIPGVDRAVGGVSAIAYLLNSSGKVAANSNGGSAGYAWTGLGSTSVLASGAAPTGPDQVVLDKKTAETANIAVGTSATILLPDGTKKSATVSGLYVPPGSDLGGGASVAFEPNTAQKLLLKPGKWSEIQVALSSGADPAQVKQQISSALGSEFDLSTRAEQIKSQKDSLGTIVNIFTYVLLGFALVSLLVGGFLIANTFNMIVAQRSREMALLRAIGARRKQVTRALLIEALVIGAVGAVLGMLLGLGIAVGLASLLSLIGLQLSFTPQLTPTAVIAALAVGIVVTVVSAYLPTRRAAKIAPVQALRESVAVPDGPSRVRTVIGVILFVLAGGAFVLSNAGDKTGTKALWAGVGGFALVATAIALAPILATVLIRILPRTRRASVRLARANTVRNPRRTASTAAALMVGLALVSAVTVVASSITASIGKLISSDEVKLDYAVSSTYGEVDPALQAKIQRTSGVGSALVVRNFRAEVGGTPESATANGGALSSVFVTKLVQGTIDQVARGTFTVDDDSAKSRGWSLGQSVSFTYPNGKKQTLRLAGTYKAITLVSGIQTNIEDYRAATGDDAVDSVDVVAATGTDLASLRTSLEAVTADNPLMKVQSIDDVKQRAGGQVTTLLSIIYGLLALSLIIAVLGVVNTMAMSVLERTREIGLLRAVGLTQRQSRTMIRRESVLIAMLGALLGMTTGLVIGVFMQRSLASTGIEKLSIPWIELAAFLVLAALIGVIAALAPARRAARMDVLAAISTT